MIKSKLFIWTALMLLYGCDYEPTKATLSFKENKLEITHPNDRFVNSLDVSVLDSNGNVLKTYSYTDLHDIRAIDFDEEMGISLSDLVTKYPSIEISFYSENDKNNIVDVCSERFSKEAMNSEYHIHCYAR